MTTDYGYRSITTRVPSIAGTIERGSVARRQKRGQAFHSRGPVTILINRTNGHAGHITVLDADGRAVARLDSSTALY